MAQTGGMALAQELESFGKTMNQAALTIYKVESENRARVIVDDIARKTQEFHQALEFDPDAGVPTAAGAPAEPGAPAEATGYMKKWDAYDKKVREEIDKSDATPMTKRMVKEYWNQESLRSKNDVFQRQTIAWKGSQVTRIDRLNKNAIETWTGDSQGLMDYCASNIQTLRSQNVIDQATADQMIAEKSQIVLRKTISSKLKTVYDEAGGGDDGLAAARNALEKESHIVSYMGNDYGLGDQTRKMVDMDIAEYNETVQIEENDRMQAEWANLLLRAQGRNPDPDHPGLMTISGIQKSKLSAAGKEHWIEKFINWQNAAGGDEASKAKYRQLATVLKVMQERYNANQGRGGLEPIMLNGESLPITTATMDRLMRDNFNELTMFCGDDMVQIEKGFQLMKAPNQGAWADARVEIEKTVKDPYLRAQALEALDNTHHLDGAESWDAKKIQDAKTEILANNYLKSNLSAGLWQANGKVEGDATKITNMLWNKELRLHIGGRDGQEPMPQMKQSRDALEQYSAAVQKGVQQFFGKDETDKQIWIPIDTQGNYQRATVRTNKDGTRTTYQPVPLVDKNGKTSMTFLVTTTKTGVDHFLEAEKGIGRIVSDGGTVKYQLLDVSANEGRGALIDVTPQGNMRPEGWSLLSTGERADIAAKRWVETTEARPLAAGSPEGAIEAARKAAAKSAQGQEEKRDASKSAIDRIRGGKR